MSFGHSLAEAPSHHTAQVVVQGSLGHSPDSPLKDPRWRVALAQDADGLARQEDVVLTSQSLYVYGWGVMLEKKATMESFEAAQKAAALAAAKKEAAENEAKLKKEAAEEAAKLKKEAEEALKKAVAEVKGEDKKKPIKFKDAVGRKFSFPFHLCATWAVCLLQLLFATSG